MPRKPSIGFEWGAEVGEVKSIVLEICRQHRVGPEEFFSVSRKKWVLEARIAAIKALREAGFGKAAVGRLIRRSAYIARYWEDEEYRARKRVQNREKARLPENVAKRRLRRQQERQLRQGTTAPSDAVL